MTKRYAMTKVYQGEPGAEGPQGPMGNPRALGVNKDLSKITVAGFNDDGTFGATQGRSISLIETDPNAKSTMYRKTAMATFWVAPRAWSSSPA